MKATQLLHNLGQGIWLDHDAAALEPAALERYIFECSVTGLTSSPQLSDRDSTRAADLFRPIHDRTGGMDGWVSVRRLGPAARPNLLVEIPGTTLGLVAVEEAIFTGVPVNVTLLFSREQYLSAAEAYLRGIERRLEAGRDPRVFSAASISVGRWDAAVEAIVPRPLRNCLGIAVAKRIYRSARALLTSPRWQRLQHAGAPPQRLVWTAAPAVLYAKALAAPMTVISLSEAALNALARRQAIGSILPADGGDCEELLARFAACGIELDQLSHRLQAEEAGASNLVLREFVAAAVR